MTKTKSSPSRPKRPELGAVLKRLRAERDLSLTAFAAMTGLPQSTLSKVENGAMSLNYDKLARIASVLEIEIGQLFSMEAEGGSGAAMARRVIDRRSDKFTPRNHLQYQYLSTDLRNRLMLPIVFLIDTPVVPDAELEMMDILGQRFAFVLEGPVDFLCDQYETVTLQAGDALYIDSAMPHTFAARDGRQARVLSVLASSNPHYLELARQATLQGIADASEAFRRQQRDQVAHLSAEKTS